MLTESQLLNSLLSAIDPSATPRPSASAPRQTQAAGVSTQATRPTASTNGATQSGMLKRKADAQTESGQVKVQRKEGSIHAPRPINAARPAINNEVPKTKSPVPANTIPYRGTAGIGGLGAAKSPSVAVKKIAVSANNGSVAAKSSGPPSRSAVTPTSASTLKPTSAPASGVAPIAAPKKGYAAMLQRAKEREQTKAPAPPVRHEPTKILTKKEREALRAAAKGKGPAVNAQKAAANSTKKLDPKAKSQEKGKPTGYQGTARPIKKPVEIGYRGTAKPTNVAPGSAGKMSGTSMSKSKPNQQSGRFDGYANWSDLDEDIEEEDYESEDDMSDMEGGIWDVEQEEQLALQAARKEDAAALAEENELKRQKEERKRKLAAMNKAAAAKRRY